MMEIRMGSIVGNNVIKAVGFSGVAGDTATMSVLRDYHLINENNSPEHRKHSGS
jgi:hypothetical protein